MGFNIAQGLNDGHFLQNAKNLGYCQLIKTKGKKEAAPFPWGRRKPGIDHHSKLNTPMYWPQKGVQRGSI